MASVAERLRTNSDTLLSVFDLLGTLVFALEGALAAIRGNLDVLGLLVLAFVTAVGGGIIRDVLIGAVPPVAIRDWRYLGIAMLGAAGASLLYYWERTLPDQLLLTLDAAGLSLFAIAGVEKALDYTMHPLMAVVMGGITGVGGGTVRDLLLAKVPGVLHRDVYASAALLGGLVMVLALKAKAPRAVAMLAGGGACFLLRMVSLLRQWNLPRILHL
ncbi:MAG: hypothetical protein QOK38_566 [Acidobacteriaceae bacterium]|jgi:uncharacterized membrane protein YeiH|nr:hypothetical protein [Acidobacteriaceae bacterium]